MKFILALVFTLPFMSFAQEMKVVEGLPPDLEKSKIIFFKHEKIKITADKKSGSEGKYLHERQTNHNKVIQEANQKLNIATFDYPYDYAISSKSVYKPLLKAGYKYILDSKAYSYENLKTQPNEGELIIYEYFIIDPVKKKAYKVFELDEMKIYDSKLMIKKLSKAIKKNG